MKIYILVALSMIVTTSPAFADQEYKMKVLGAVCPNCAYGLEKKFKKIEGFKSFDLDFKKGIATVCTKDNVVLSDEDMTKLFNDAGFTYKGQEVSNSCQKI